MMATLIATLVVLPFCTGFGILQLLQSININNATVNVITGLDWHGKLQKLKSINEQANFVAVQVLVAGSTGPDDEKN
jgi:hypothetical protein